MPLTYISKQHYPFTNKEIVDIVIHLKWVNYCRDLFFYLSTKKIHEHKYFVVVSEDMIFFNMNRYGKSNKRSEKQKATSGIFSLNKQKFFIIKRDKMSGGVGCSCWHDTPVEKDLCIIFGKKEKKEDILLSPMTKALIQTKK